MDLLHKIEQYQPWDEQEARDKEELLRRIRRGESLYTRDNTQAHWTASAWVVDPERKQVLMAYHKLYDSWAWLGGHADGERDLLAVAIREAREESGLERVCPVTEEIYSLEILPVSSHEKRGEVVPAHLHFNLTFLLEADPDAPLRNKEDENSAVAWFSPSAAAAASTEPRFRNEIYPKLNAKLHAVKKESTGR